MGQRCVVLLLGETGSGKSTFAKLVTSELSIQISHGLEPGTNQITAYKTRLGSGTCIVIDTPGLNDDYSSNWNILQQALELLNSPSYATSNATFILYFHQITQPRFQRSAQTNLLMFTDFFRGSVQNLVLATTFWGCLSRTAVCQQIGERREEELVSTNKFWGSMIQQGAQIRRIPETRQECLSLLLDIIAHGNRRPSCPEAPVKPSMAPSGRRTSTAEDLERVRTEHERQKQEYMEEFEELAQDLQRRLTLEHEHHQQSEHQIQRAQEKDLAIYRMQQEDMDHAMDEFAQIERRQSEQLESLQRNLTAMSDHSQYQKYQNRWVYWRQHCDRMNKELALLQAARNANPALSYFNARVDTICCNNCFVSVKKTEHYYSKYPGVHSPQVVIDGHSLTHLFLHQCVTDAGAVNFSSVRDASMNDEHTAITLNINLFDICRCVIKATVATRSKI